MTRVICWFRFHTDQVNNDPILIHRIGDRPLSETVMSKFNWNHICLIISILYTFPLVKPHHSVTPPPPPPPLITGNTFSMKCVISNGIVRFALITPQKTLKGVCWLNERKLKQMQDVPAYPNVPSISSFKPARIFYGFSGWFSNDIFRLILEE